MKEAKLKDIDFSKEDGLIPVVAQEYGSRRLLMLAYANKGALVRTLQTGFAHYWSRSRRRLWKKGETSGHLQTVREVLVDCDADALIYIVDQKGNACHTGKKSCFFRRLPLKKRDRGRGSRTHRD